MKITKSFTSLLFVLLLASSAFGQFPIPSGVLSTSLPPIPSGLLSSPSPAIPSGAMNSPSPPIPSGSLSSPSPPIPSGSLSSPSPAVPSNIPTPSYDPSPLPSGAVASPSAAAVSPSRAASRSPTPMPALQVNITNATLEAFPDNSCRTAIQWFFNNQVAYFGAIIETVPETAVTARNLRTVCFQQGNGTCYQAYFDTYAAANGRDPVFSVDLANTNIALGEPYNVYATIGLLLSNGTTAEVRVSTTITAEDTSNIQSPSSGSQQVNPMGWNAAVVLMMLAVVNWN